MEGRELVLGICGGNPGCLSVVMRLLKADRSAVTKLFDLGYRGPFVWLIYKDLLDEDLDRLHELLNSGQLSDEIEKKIQEDPRFAREWRYTEKHYR